MQLCRAFEGPQTVETLITCFHPVPGAIITSQCQEEEIRTEQQVHSGFRCLRCNEDFRCNTLILVLLL